YGSQPGGEWCDFRHPGRLSGLLSTQSRASGVGVFHHHSSRLCGARTLDRDAGFQPDWRTGWRGCECLGSCLHGAHRWVFNRCPSCAPASRSRPAATVLLQLNAIYFPRRRRSMRWGSLLFLLLIPSLLLAAEPIDKHPEWDQDYSAKIREYTTGPQFMTDLV